MSITVSVITTANRTCRFALEAPDHISHLLNSLKRSASIFSGSPLIIGSPEQTSIFSSASIACIEIETSRDLADFLPGQPTPTFTALTLEEARNPFEWAVEEEYFKARIDFYFHGGHVLNTHVEGPRKTALAERLMNLTSIFERPVILYKLPQGGVGIMNPHAMTRAEITPGVPDLPRDAWIASTIER